MTLPPLLIEQVCVWYRQGFSTSEIITKLSRLLGRQVSWKEVNDALDYNL